MNAPNEAAVRTGAEPTPEALRLIDSLLGFPTVSRDSNLALIEFARDHLVKLGAKPRLVYESSGRKANLFCSLGDEGAMKSGGLVLSGHTDTVPVDGQDWNTDPFKATHADGRIYARGSADMKGFIATALAWAPRFLDAQARTPIHLSLTFDEETTFLGVKTLLADLEERGIKPAACIIGEPTDMQVIVAHKGKRDWCCRVRGREAHSSLTPTGVNAIEFAAQIIGFIRGLAERQARDEKRDARFSVPYSTLQTGVIRGGIAVNVVPRDCEFDFEMRNIPATSQDALSDEIIAFTEREVLPKMRAVAADSVVTFQRGMSLPAFGIAVAAALVEWAQDLAETRHLGPGAVGFATEASMFMQAGIPTVVLGPGSIEQAHKPNEYLTYAQVAACEQLFERLVAQPLPDLRR
ncbi:MAG TPA: acetylornithine deacetylase [Burkholderiaceae bacterium]|jgi:acetylornithine deacetylase|nr:acetylornithine deacetylase [Burkholderiaceae bacterium]